MRKSWLAAMACAVPLVLSACGGSAPVGAAGGASGAKAGETIKIGALHPLSGSSAADGQAMDNAAKLAVEEINKAGGIKSLKGAKLALLSADTQGKPEVGQSELQSRWSSRHSSPQRSCFSRARSLHCSWLQDAAVITRKTRGMKRMEKPQKKRAENRGH